MRDSKNIICWGSEKLLKSELCSLNLRNFSYCFKRKHCNNYYSRFNSLSPAGTRKCLYWRMCENGMIWTGSHKFCVCLCVISLCRLCWLLWWTSPLRSLSSLRTPDALPQLWSHDSSATLPPLTPQQQDTSAVSGVKLPLNAVCASVLFPPQNRAGRNTETENTGRLVRKYTRSTWFIFTDNYPLPSSSIDC